METEFVMSMTTPFQVLFDRNPLAVAVLEPNGRVTAVNPAFERLFGPRSRTAVGRGAEIFLDTKDRAGLDGWLARARHGHEVHVDAHGAGRNGQVLDLRLSLLPHFATNGNSADGNSANTANGGVGVVYAIYRDLTNEHQLEEQLQQATKMEAFGHLAGGVAHDFNNLLTAILGYSEMLELALGEQQKLRGQAQEIRKAAERAGRLTRKLLAFSRKEDVQPSYLNLNSVLLELERMLKKFLGERVRYDTDFDVDLGLVFIDPVQLEQVIINLIVNARDAMLEGGKVTGGSVTGGSVTIATGKRELSETLAEEYPACHPGSYIVVRVTDDGCGMDLETAAHIFEPFYTTKGPGKGTGLGLASVYGIVTQNGGYVPGGVWRRARAPVSRWVCRSPKAARRGSVRRRAQVTSVEAAKRSWWSTTRLRSAMSCGVTWS